MTTGAALNCNLNVPSQVLEPLKGLSKTSKRIYVLVECGSQKNPSHQLDNVHLGCFFSWRKPLLPGRTENLAGLQLSRTGFGTRYKYLSISFHKNFLWDYLDSLWSLSGISRGCPVIHPPRREVVT